MSFLSAYPASGVSPVDYAESGDLIGSVAQQSEFCEDKILDKLANVALSLAAQLAAINSSLERCSNSILNNFPFQTTQNLCE